jgi:hypothetical protein
MRVLLVLLVALFVAGCGDDAEKEASAPAPSTELTVTVYPEGSDKPGETTTVTDAKGLTAKDFEPVPGNVACTEIFGGPQTATVTGTLAGAPIDAEFSRANGCEIARWVAAAPVLGEAPSGP